MEVEQRLIDATKLLQVLDRNFGSLVEVLQQLIVVQSTVEVAPVVHGRRIMDSGIYSVECSLCGYQSACLPYPKDCPNCNIKMDGESGDKNG